MRHTQAVVWECDGLPRNDTTTASERKLLRKIIVADDCLAAFHCTSLLLLAEHKFAGTGRKRKRKKATIERTIIEREHRGS